MKINSINVNKENFSQKILAEYIRTSSGGQELKLQIGTNAPHLEEHNPDNILRFTDQDVSATKLSMEDRPALNRMLKLVQAGKISTIVVYERDRLARNVYEYIQMVTLFYINDVNVIFTATNATPFSKDLFVETWYGLSAQFEGQRITNRLSDARKRNPSNLIGYQKIKSSSNSKGNINKYIPLKEQKDVIYNLFLDFSKVSSPEDIYNITIRYQSLLNRQEIRILDILKTPFFSGHYDNNGSFVRLPNVEPIISLDLFKSVQNRLEEFSLDITDGFSLSKKESKVVPRCGICNQELKFKKGQIGTFGFYKCSKHKKIQIEVNELIEKTTESLQKALKQISFSELYKLYVKVIKNNIAQCRKSSEKMQKKLARVCLEFAILFDPKVSSLKMEKKIKEIDSLRNQLADFEEQIVSLETLMEEIALLEEFSKVNLSELINTEYDTLLELLVNKIAIHPEYVHFDYYFSDFFNKGDSEYAS